MAKPRWEWFGRHRYLVIALLLVVVAIESFLLYQQRRVSRAIEAQSSKLLTNSASVIFSPSAKAKAPGEIPWGFVEEAL